MRMALTNVQIPLKSGRLYPNLRAEERVFMTSRGASDLVVSGPYSQIMLDMDMVQSDIARYIKWRLTHDIGLGSIKDELKTFIEDQLLLQSFGA